MFQREMSACPVFLDNHEFILPRQSAVTLVGLCVRRSEEVMNGIGPWVSSVMEVQEASLEYEARNSDGSKKVHCLRVLSTKNMVVECQ